MPALQKNDIESSVNPSRGNGRRSDRAIHHVRLWRKTIFLGNYSPAKRTKNAWLENPNLAADSPQSSLERVDTMADKTSKTRPKRLSKGQRIHVRRLKQAARKAGAVHS